MTTVDLLVSGMSCEMCVGHVRRALLALEGVETVELDLSTGTCRVRGENLEAPRLIAAVEEEGYSANPA